MNSTQAQRIVLQRFIKLHRNDFAQWMRFLHERKRKTRSWKDIDFQRQELEKFANELGVKELDDWYTVSKSRLYSKLPFIQKKYKNIFSALKNLYPDHPWNETRFFSPTKDIEVQRKKLNEIGKELGVKHLDDWYSVSRQSVYSKASFVTPIYGNLLTALKTLYPQHPWDASKLSFSTQGYWKDMNNQRHKLEEVGAEFGVNQLDDWYSVPRNKIIAKAKFVEVYYGNLFTALKTLYPHHPWDETKFARARVGQWRDLRAQRQKLDRIGRELGVRRLDDWYHVPQIRIASKATFITAYYHNMFEALCTIYPEHPWDEFRFEKVPWKRMESKMKNIIQELIEKHDIRTQDHWYQLHCAEWKRVKSFAVARYGSLSNMFKTLYPSLQERNLFSRRENSLQKMLAPVTKVETQVSISGHSIDVFLPEWRVALEYQGDQHYRQTHRGSLTDQLNRDQRKKRDLEALGITLVQVPFWWKDAWSHLSQSILHAKSLKSLPTS